MVTVHRRDACTSHSMDSLAVEKEAFEPEPFLVLLGIVAVEEQQRKAGSREMNGKSGMRVAQNLRCDESQAMIHSISSPMYPYFRFFPVLFTGQKQGSSIIYGSGGL